MGWKIKIYSIETWNVEDEDQDSEAHSQVKNLEVENDMTDPTETESMGDEPAGAENKETIDTT